MSKSSAKSENLFWSNKFQSFQTKSDIFPVEKNGNTNFPNLYRGFLLASLHFVLRRFAWFVRFGCLFCFGLLCLLSLFDLLGFACCACLCFTYLLYLAVICEVWLGCEARSLACSRFWATFKVFFQNNYFLMLFILLSMIFLQKKAISHLWLAY